MPSGFSVVGSAARTIQFFGVLQDHHIGIPCGLSRATMRPLSCICRQARTGAIRLLYIPSVTFIMKYCRTGAEGFGAIMMSQCDTNARPGGAPTCRPYGRWCRIGTRSGRRHGASAARVRRQLEPACGAGRATAVPIRRDAVWGDRGAGLGRCCLLLAAGNRN